MDRRQAVIWLIGDRGMLGAELADTFAALKIDFIGTGREIDIRDKVALGRFAAGKRIGWIVNCAAYTAVDKAEEEPELAAAINSQGPANIASVAEAIGSSILQVSTDYVFEGNGTRPYREDDPVGPMGVYGRTKADGERAALRECGRTVIVRTSWLYGKHGANFVRTMLQLMRERESIGVVADQKGSPTWARDLSRAIAAIVTKTVPTYGIYHFAGSGETNWCGFAREIHESALKSGLLERPCEIKALTTAEYPTKAVRPPYSVLCSDKIRADYGVTVPEWKESLSAFLGEMRETRE